MKKIFFFFLITYFSISAYSQNTSLKFSSDSVRISSKVEFFIFDGPYGNQKNFKKPAIRFIVTVKNLGTKPIPDLGVSNRSQYLNLYINDSLKNPLSLYNGLEATGHHLLLKETSDTYTWWLFEDMAYSNIFTVQWKYLDLFSEKYKINKNKKKIQLVK